MPIAEFGKCGVRNADCGMISLDVSKEIGNCNFGVDIIPQFNFRIPQ
jgi:hypothetical protein